MRQALASRTMPDPDPEPHSTPPPTPGEMADKFPLFEITECLGRGGMGVVYKARQKSLDRWVAIKILAPERVGEKRFSERFAREAKTLASLNHPNIVTVFDYGETDGLFYIVMEFVDGVNLRDLLRDGKLDPEQALAIVPPICEALQYAHDNGIVHRDIKPENLLLDRDGRIKIADFGIAALVGTRGEQSGTPPYMAPEQGEPSSGIDHRADIYALGAVLYEMLTGERPGTPLQPPSQKVQVDIRIDDIVLRALSKEPERRYRTADEFRTMLETVVSTPAPPALATPASPAPRPPISSAMPLDPRWSRVAAILMMILGAINIAATVLSLVILPIIYGGIMEMVYSGLGDTRFGGALGDIPPWFRLSLIILATLLSTAASILAIVGGRHMFKGSSRNWAITGAVACCLIKLWWPLGLAVGVFAIVVLLMDKETAPEALMPGRTPGVIPTKPSGPSSRLSGMAVTGAVLQALFVGLIGLILLYLSLSAILNMGGVPSVAHLEAPELPEAGSVVAASKVARPVAVGGFALAFPLLPMIFFSVPGCILGWIAAGRIRASQGRLRGMGFATFAAMVPVVLLTTAILAGAGAMVLHIFLGKHMDIGNQLVFDKITLILIVTAICLTGLALLGLILGFCFRYLRGTPAAPRRRRRLVVASALAILWIALGVLLWLQRPRQVDACLSSSTLSACNIGCHFGKNTV